MTIEEKAKAYDEALKRAKEVYNRGYYVSGDIEHIFPELKESEDERIRKALIEVFSNREKYLIDQSFGDITVSEALTWLEKQGEKLPVGFYYVNSEGKKFYSDTFKYGDVTLHVERQGEIDNCPLECSTNTVMTDSTKNQVKPKFKVSDWINGCYTNYKVLSVNNKGYVVEDVYGNKINILFENEKFHHLWTIQDAKDGDVLMGKIDGDNYILIFKQVKDGWVETYGHYYDSVDRFCVPSQLFCRDYQGSFTPATKEQRDLLFQKMKEAGYEWDADKKELKKISQRMISAEAKEAMYAKTAWSEDDEKMLVDAYVMLDWYKGNNWWTALRIKDWLNSLKERIGG